MKSKINIILWEIDKKKNELKIEYTKLMDKYGFSLISWKIVFNNETKKENKRFKKPLFDTIFSARIREILSIPFIYFMIFPAVFLDISLFMYQYTALKLYKIPVVKRSDYIIFDRWKLDYLNIIQKINCLYCSYVNWLFTYAVEIWWRTEKYWCPIKHAKKLKWWHDWQEHFADYGDPKRFKEVFHSIKEFEKLKK